MKNKTTFMPKKVIDTLPEPFEVPQGPQLSFIRDTTEMDIDDLLARAEQAFKIRQYALNEHQRDALKKYGRSLVEQAVNKLDELNAAE